MSPMRRLYLYLVALVSLMALMFGLIGLVAEVIGLWFNASPWQITRAELSQGGLLIWALVVVISAPLWAMHWSLANREAGGLAMTGAAERSASARKSYFYAGQFLALTTLVLLIWALLFDIFLHILARGDIFPLPLGRWPARPITLAACALIAFLFWFYLHGQAREDGDVGHEPESGAGWRRAYQYIPIFLGTAFAALGAAEFLRIVLELAGRIFPTSAAPGVDTWRETAAASLAAFVVGLALAWSMWRWADWIAADDASGGEVNSLGRKLTLYACLVAGVLGSILTAGFLVMLATMIILGLPASDPRVFWDQNLAPILAYLPVALLLWWIFGRALHDDMEWAPESADAAVFRRLYFYLMAGLTLAAFWYGLQQVLSVALFLLLRLEPVSALQIDAARTPFSVAAGLLLVGGPAWWWHWQRAQHWARQPGPAGHEERTSLLRKMYLYGVVLAAAGVVAITLGMVIYRAPSWLFDPGRQTEFVAAVAQFGVAVALALVWWLGNGLVMRTDARMVAEEAPAEEDVTAQYETEEWVDILPEDAELGDEFVQPYSPAPDLRPGQYDRSQLPKLGMAAALARQALPEDEAAHVAVLDGGNGTVGTMLLRELRQRLPDLVLWPIGLNATAQAAMERSLGEVPPRSVPPDALEQALAILGPNDIVTPGGLAGEVPAELAAAVLASPARKILLPPADPRLRWVAAPDWSSERWIQQAVAEVAGIVNG